ncbi:hypothetical protein MKW98_023884 [Papaver atlanticum]|uniref:Homeobox domain-containing protein n=1 Tax=Papaver atlanticum TaxID=357466 RepID=A0AAD4XN48_9MAGN|nr:hypothetical protein MKW98_023884 [Papaver atlanticum]
MFICVRQEPEPSDMSEFEVVKYETKIVSPDSAIVFSDVPKLEHMAMLFTLSRKGNNKIKFDDTLWSPSPEQIRILEMLYNGGLRSPTVQQIEQITSQLIQYGKVELTDVCIWFKTREDQERWEKQLSMEGLKIAETPTSPKISEQDKGKAVSIEGKSETGKGVSMSLKMPDPESQEKRGSDNSMIEKSPTSPTVSVRDKGKTVSGEEESGIGKEVSILTEISGPVSREKEGSDNSRYDSTGKLLSVDSKKQREQIPSAQENIDSEPHIPSQQQISLPTVSSSTSSTREEESRPEGQNNMKIADPKRRRWFNLFPWWQKK